MFKRMMQRLLSTIFMLGIVLQAFAVQDSVHHAATDSLSIVAADSAHTVIQYADTFRIDNALNRMDNDALLVRLIQEQGKRLIAERDSLWQIRLNTDTTTAFPFHVGLRDSLAIAANIKKHPYHPLAVPLYFVMPVIPSLADTMPEELNIYTLRQSARTYLANHCAEVYVGFYDSIDYQAPTELPATRTRDLLLPTKSLVFDAEEERKDRLRAIRNQFSPWRREALVMLQLTQNYVSKNWYAGGNSNFAILGMAQGSYIYDNKKNITWENTAEWRMGFNTTDGDSLRKVNTNEDIFKIYSKLGFKAFGKFSYSLSADFQTHFFHTWKENTHTTKTSPLTPIRLNIAFGLDYKPISGLSIVFSPINYKMVYANDTVHVPQTSFGIEEGKKTLNEVGSSLRVDWAWKPVREIALDAKFYCYTNYKKVELDLEIACDFIINRYFSARLMLHPRYDNTVILPNDERAKIQFKELLSIGFAHKFR